MPTPEEWLDATVGTTINGHVVPEWRGWVVGVFTEPTAVVEFADGSRETMALSRLVILAEAER